MSELRAFTHTTARSDSLLCLAGRAAVIVVDTLKGHVRCGSAWYWVISLSLVPLIALVSAAVAWWLVAKNNIKSAASYELPDGEVSSQRLHSGAGKTTPRVDRPTDVSPNDLELCLPSYSW